MEKLFKISISSVLKTILGTMLVAFGTAVFILPFELITGGVAGISIVLSKLIAIVFNGGAEWLTVDMLVGVISWGLFFLGLAAMGRDFAMKTLVSTIVYPLFISLFLHLSTSGIFSGYFDLSASTLGGGAIIVASVFGGVLIGTGCSVTFLAGGSSGGVDILAFVICKYKPGLRTSNAILIIDAIVILLGSLVTPNIAITLLGITTVLVTTTIIDRIFLGAGRAYSAHIITEQPEKISSLIIERLSRTSTIIKARGGYSGKEKSLLFVTFGLREYSALRNLVDLADPGAFIAISSAHEIYGEGWLNKSDK